MLFILTKQDARKEKRSEYEVFVGTPIKKFEISDTQFGLYHEYKKKLKTYEIYRIKSNI